MLLLYGNSGKHCRYEKYPLAAFIQVENRPARTDRFFVMADDDGGTQLAQRTRSFVRLFEKMEGTTLPQYRLGWGHAVE